MERSVEASLQRLHTDHLDVLIAHDIEFADDFEAVFTDTAAVLHGLKAAGKCRFVGMSGLPLGILRTAIEAATWTWSSATRTTRSRTRRS